MYVMLRLVEEREERECVYMYSFIDSKQPFYDCASLKMTLFLKKNLFFSFYLPIKISKFSILIKPTL